MKKSGADPCTREVGCVSDPGCFSQETENRTGSNPKQSPALQSGGIAPPADDGSRHSDQGAHAGEVRGHKRQ
jgi:hypothetical protein